MSKKTNILVIDDDEVFLMISRVNLESCCKEATIITVDNGLDALQIVEKELPSHIFLDINMPLMNGWEFLDALSAKDTGCNFQLYITTSSVDPGDKIKAGKHPMVTGFVEKPLNAAKIKALNICRENA